MSDRPITLHVAWQASSDMSDGAACCQVAAKIVKAGPDNGTVYMTGMGVMYKEHEILVEVNNDGSGVICASLSSSFRQSRLHITTADGLLCSCIDRR